MRVVDGEEDLLKELAGIFLAESPQRLTQIRESVERSDREALRRAAHGLKGSASQIAAVGVTRASASLELIAREDRMGEAAAGLASLEAEIDRLAPLLDACRQEPTVTS